MIKDAINPILLHQVHPPSSSCMTYFEGTFFLDKTIERPSVSIDIDISSQRVEPTTTIDGERAIETCTPASSFTSAPVVTSTIDPRPTNTRFMSVP